MWTQIFEYQWFLGVTPFESGTSLLCLLGTTYLSYLLANVVRIARAVQKGSHQPRR